MEKTKQTFSIKNIKPLTLAAAALALCVALIAIICLCFADLQARNESHAEIKAFYEEAKAQKSWKNVQTKALFEKEIEKEIHEEENIVAQIVAPNGIKFLSYSKYWNEEKLLLLYEELMKNEHGNEMDYLGQVIVHGTKEKENTVGAQEEKQQSVPLYLVSSALPKNFHISLAATMSNIHLYGGNERTTVASMARTLSHEYGHHFTNYYFFSDMSASAVRDCAYTKTRNLSDSIYRYEISSSKDYSENHQWYVFEIAAEDYVSLMGSSLARRTLDFKDTKESLEYYAETGKQENTSKFADTAVNSAPQENMNIPFAWEVEGLEELFYSKIGKKSERKYEVAAKDIAIMIEKIHDTYYLQTGVNDYISYKISFEMPYKESGTTYTLVAYNGNNEMIRPIKTVGIDEDASAFIGNIAISDGKYLYSIDDGIANGERILRIIVTFKDGRIFVTPPYKYTFGE